MKRITKIVENASLGKKKIRVAAYCRVSTASEEQLVSLAAQKAHYENYINPMTIGNLPDFTMTKASLARKKKSGMGCWRWLPPAREE